jgi:hypothetical protein
LKQRDHFEVPGIDGRIMDLQELGCGSKDWIELDQERDRWWALLNVIMKL